MNINLNLEKHMKNGRKMGGFDVKRDNYRKKKIFEGEVITIDSQGFKELMAKINTIALLTKLN